LILGIRESIKYLFRWLRWDTMGCFEIFNRWNQLWRSCDGWFW